jgi:orotidine-5'-phosphate decarboxylase
MSGANFADRLAEAIDRRRTPAVVGLDPLLESLPAELAPAEPTARAAAAALERFCGDVIDIVSPLVPAVKINSGFFEAYFEHGVAAFFRLVRRARSAGLLVIADIKRGDIGSTASLYCRGHLESPRLADVSDEQMPDAVTLAGYLGAGAVKPFLEAARRTGRGMYILVRPSDPGADEVHEFRGGVESGRPFYRHIAELVSRWGQGDGLMGSRGLSCVGAVVAPKDAASTMELRAAMPHTPWLVPGYGAQGASSAACRPCFLPGGRAALVNASRSVIFAFRDPRWQARCGDDWRAAIGHAAMDFARDIAAASQA